MVTRILSKTRALWLCSSLALVCQAGAQTGGADPHAGHDHAEEAATATAQSNVSDADALNAMGRLMAQQLRLNIGFSDEELDSIFEGMRAVANGEDNPEAFEQQVQRAQQIYMSKMREFQEKEMERAQKLAADNREKGEAYLQKIEQENPDVKKTESGLRYEILEEGDGKQPTKADRVTVNYTGTLIDGTEFDSGQGTQFPLRGVVPSIRVPV